MFAAFFSFINKIRGLWHSFISRSPKLHDDHPLMSLHKVNQHHVVTLIFTAAVVFEAGAFFPRHQNEIGLFFVCIYLFIYYAFQPSKKLLNKLHF